MSTDDNSARGIKRIRQACLNCRRKKVRCSGDRPYCTLCKRTSQACRYAESDWSSLGDSTEPELLGDAINVAPSCPHPLPDQIPEMHRTRDDSVSGSEVVTRLHMLENKVIGLEKVIQDLVVALAEDRRSREAHILRAPVDNIVCQRESPPHISTLVDDDAFKEPSAQQIQVSLDTYFQHCYSQPYCIFHEQSFRERIAAGQVPKGLLYAFVASASRYSLVTDQPDERAQVVSSNATRAWNSIVLPWNSGDSSVVLPIIQTIFLLSIIDYTDGRCSSAWIKLGMAIRLAQHIRLAKEPDIQLSLIEREERRRVFWSLYILDKLISCGRERSPAILDEDCKVSMPCSESAFKAGVEEHMPHLEELTGDSPPVTTLSSSSPFALVVLMTSTLCRVTKYALQEHKYVGNGIPWSAGSEYAAIDSMLLQLESNFGFGDFLDLFQRDGMINGGVNQQTAGPLVFSCVLFHLCHVLLHHPFLMRQRLAKLDKKAPASFQRRARKTCQYHAQALSTVIEDANREGCLTNSSFYGYCHMVAGSIHALVLASGGDSGNEIHRQLYKSSLEKLLHLGRFWKSAGLMVRKLEELRTDQGNSSLFDLDLHTEGRDQPTIKSLWESVDYWALSTSTPHNERADEPQADIVPPTIAENSFDMGIFDFTHWPEIGRSKTLSAALESYLYEGPMNLDPLQESDISQALLGLPDGREPQ